MVCTIHNEWKAGVKNRIEWYRLMKEARRVCRDTDFDGDYTLHLNLPSSII